MLRQRVIVSGHKALVRDVGELEELLSKVSRTRGKEPAKVLERKLARSRAWDVVPELVLPVEALDELRKLLTLLSRDGKIFRDDEDAVAVSAASRSWDTQIRYDTGASKFKSLPLNTSACNDEFKYRKQKKS